MAAYTTIDDPSAYFKVQLYTGDGAANHAITFDDTDTDMQPDFVWIKNRDATDSHCLFDSVRGVTKHVSADTNREPHEETDTDSLQSFDSDGFELDAEARVNTDTEKYVAWCWKESTTAGFDIVIYTGDGVEGREVTHGLGAVPEMICVISRGDGGRNRVYHHKMTDAPETEYMNLTSDGATYDNPAWGDTVPTSSVWTTGVDAQNANTFLYVAYLWKGIQGFSKFGGYEGNGNADGKFVYTGFRPAFVMIKAVDSTGAWQMFDDKREGYNPDNDALDADTNVVETTTDYIDLLSNGFKCRTTGDPNVAESYIYMAFAEAPFVNSNGVPCNAR